MEETVETDVSQGETSTAKYDNNTCQPELLEYLSSAYEVLRKVFSYLYLDDIVNAVEVFESWKTVAEITRKERLCIESFVISDQKYKMSKIWSEAVFCICFCTAQNREIEEEVTKFITQDGEFIHCLSGAGVIGTVHDLSHIVQQKIRVGLSVSRKKFHLTTIRFPKVPKVDIRTYVWEENMDFNEFKNSCDIPENQVVKCLIILMIVEGSERRTHMQKDHFIHYLRHRQAQPFAIGGCIIDDFVNYSRSNASNSVTKYIVFFGDNVEAASTVLTANIKSHACIYNKIKKLKEMCPVTNKGALFVFRCAGRQRIVRIHKRMCDISKSEGKALEKYFPNTPVIGCYSYGEFGTEHPYDNDKFLSPKRFKRSFDWHFSFSTSIVYVGYLK